MNTMQNITTKTIILSMVAIAAVLSFSLISYNAFACSTSNDCAAPRFYGGQFCQNNSLYQTRITYSCINSACVSQKESYLILTCSGTNNQCVEGLWYTGCTKGSGTNNTTPTTTTTTTTSTTPSQCYSYSYQKCVGNDSYWFDSCNVQQSLSKKCGGDEICQAGSCVKNPNAYPTTTYYPSTGTTVTGTGSTQTTTYTTHFSKGCQNNIVYWYDTLGNKNDIYQNCSYSGQLCQDGTCVTDPTPKPVVYAKPATTTTTTTTPAKTTPTVSCDSGKVLAQACVPVETFTSKDQNSTNNSDSQNTQVTDNSSNQEENATQEQNNGTAAISESKTNPVMEFLTKWYTWIIIGIILTTFFIIIFRKSSSKVEGRVQKKA